MSDPSVLRDNINAIGIDPALANKLSSHVVEHLSISSTPSNQPVLTYKNHSVYHYAEPLVQVEREVNSAVEHPDWDLVVFFGYGLGFHAEQVRKRLDVPIVVFEPSLDLLKAGLSYQTHSVSDLTIVDSLSDLSGFIEITTKLGDRRILYCVVPSYLEMFPEAFERFKHTLKYTVDLMNIEDNTLLARGQVWSQYAATNLVQIPKLKPVHALKGEMEGVPGVVVGAGPSLDKNVAQLKAAKGRYVICAVNSAAKPLATKGIVPDLVVVIESNNQTENFAENAYLDQIALVVAPDSNPDHFEKIPARHKLVLGNMGVPSGDWLRRAYGYALLQSGGSVACSSLSLLHMMGCDPIILVGMDSAFTDLQSHASFSDERNVIIVHNEQKGLLEQYRKGDAAPMKTMPAQRVTAWGGKGEVFTYDGFDVYRNWFEQAAISWASDRTLINATEGGARYFEFEELALAETLDRYPGESDDISARLDQRISQLPLCRPGPLCRVIQEELSVISEVKKLSDHAIATAKKARQRIKSGKLQAATKELTKLQRSEASVGAATKKSRLLNQYIGPKITRVRQEKKCIQAGDEVAKTLDALALSIQIFATLSEGAKELTDLFSAPLDELSKG